MLIFFSCGLTGLRFFLVISETAQVLYKTTDSYAPQFERSIRWDDPDLEGRFVRAQEMSRYVEDGFFDCGLTGRDWVEENGKNLHFICVRNFFVFVRRRKDLLNIVLLKCRSRVHEESVKTRKRGDTRTRTS